MRAAIFYQSNTPAPDRHPIPLPGGGTTYVRVEIPTEGDLEGRMDLDTALDCALPRKDENVMNSHEVPDPV